MVKGVSIKFVSYEETVPKLLTLIKLGEELKKHEKVLIKPNLTSDETAFTSADFAEAVVKFCVQHKNPGAEVFLVEGADGEDTMRRFEEKGYRAIAEKYAVGLIDLNKAEAEPVNTNDFLGMSEIMYPSILKDGLLISLPKLAKSERHDMHGSLSNMIGAYPSKYYKTFFSKVKNKLMGSAKYQIHDIIRCRMPSLALMDAHEFGYLLAGQPMEIDKQGAKLLGLDWKAVPHIRLLEESIKARVKEPQQGEDVKQ